MVLPDLPSRVLVLGLGGSGLAAARLAASRGVEVWVSDQRSPEELCDQLDRLPAGCRTLLGGHPEHSLDGVGMVVCSPGVAPQAPILETARQRGITILSELELAWRHRPEAPLVVVTGSNGKSTVTVLVKEMLQAGGFNAVAGGNLGTPASELVLDQSWQAWVLEVSSFQAELLTALRPQVGIFLNLSQDHLERHPDLTSYLHAKQQLFANQEPTDTLILNADDALVAATGNRARRLLFSLEQPADACLADGRLVLAGEPLLAAERLRLAGRHNLANAMAAALAAHTLGVAGSQIAPVLERFEGLPHRHRTVLEQHGVRWVNDSKATNVGATIAALQGYPDGTVHLILGGIGKGQDFAMLQPECERAAARIYLIGQDAGHIGDSLAGTAPLEQSGDLVTAIRRAHELARPGETVLLAPACASFDQFANYQQRGDRFAELVQTEVAACR